MRTGFVLPVGGSIEHLVYHPNKQPALLQHAEDQETGRSLFHVQLLNPPLILPSQAPSHKPFCLHSHYHGTQSSLLTAAQMPASPGLVPAPPAVTHGVGTLRAISMTKPPAKDPRRFTMEEGFGPGTCLRHGACDSTCETPLKSEENFLFGSLKTSKTQNN